MDFCIKAWALWQQSCDDTGQTLATDFPLLAEIPAMTRRRMSQLTKMAFQTAIAVGPGNTIPCIFASRHGDLHKTVELLKATAASEDLSPTQFALSVHNAISGQYSIFTLNKADMNAIAGGASSLHYGVLEAACRLATEDDLTDILVVYADEPAPDLYQQFCTEPAVALSLALLLSKDCGDKVTFSCEAVTEQKAESDSLLSLQSFLSAECNEVKIQQGNKSWVWHRG